MMNNEVERLPSPQKFVELRACDLITVILDVVAPAADAQVWALINVFHE